MTEHTLYQGDGFTMREVDVNLKYHGRRWLFFEWHRSPGLWWIRVFGYGLHWKNIERHPLLFSQRQPRWDAILWGKWRLQFLARTKQSKASG